ncbi:MAG TPA: hypothetical protein VJ824_13065 [Bacillota bacterium]|nr:hypothetical protein [Bacillota bacterium]
MGDNNNQQSNNKEVPILDHFEKSYGKDTQTIRAQISQDRANETPPKKKD